MINFSDFDVCKEFVNKDKSKIIKYIELLYNKDSVLNGIQNISDRKKEACKQSNLNQKSPDIINIMDMKNDDVNRLIFVYLSSFQNSNSYHQLCSDQQLFWSIQQLLQKPLDIDDEESASMKYKRRGELSEISDQIMKRINRIYSEIYAYEDTQEMAQSMIRQMLTPEQRAKIRSNV